MKRNIVSGSSLLILAALFIAITILSNALFTGTKLDLTANKMYTISQGSKNILSGLSEPINLYFFYSEKTASRMPSVSAYATQVRDLLQQFADISNGKLNVSIVDPEPFSEAEDRASQFGLQAVSAGGDKLYLGLAGTNSVDGQETITFFSQDRQSFLEYDVAKLIYNLAHPKKKAIGLMTMLPMAGGMNQMMTAPTPPWMVQQTVAQIFDVRTVSTDVEKIPDDIDALWIVHPKNLSEKTQFAIDQYVLKGGKALVFVDAYADSDPPEQGQFSQPDKGSNLPALFKSWGIEFSADKIVGDRKNGVQISISQGERATHIGYMRIAGDQLNKQDTTTSALEQLTLGTPGAFKKLADATTQFTALVSSSDDSAEIEKSRLDGLRNPQELLVGFKPSGDKYAFAARISGKAKTAFPEGPTAASGLKPEDIEKAKKDMLKESKGDINVIVVGDVDMLADPFWVRVQDFFGQQVAAPFASNGDFVSNALDNLVGSTDLIGIRGRTGVSRPFDVVAELRSKAEQNFREREKSLQKTLEETEKKLAELQSNKQDGNSKLILSPEQEKAINEFQQEKVNVRKQLREVRHELDKDIESLGSILKAINIALVPALMCLIALGVAYTRNQRRKRSV